MEIFTKDLAVIIGQMKAVLKKDGYIGTWHYPAYRLLQTGLTEEAVFEMGLFNGVLDMLKSAGFTK